MSSRPKLDRLNNSRKNIRNRIRSFTRGVSKQRVVFVTGVPRSGTNMVLDLLARSAETEVFFEHDRRIFDRFSHVSDEALLRYAQCSPAPCVVFKSLLDSQRQRHLLDLFEDAVALWLFRSCDDVVRSNVTRWPGVRNRIDEILEEPVLGGWRGAGMSDATLASLRSVYTPELSDEAANALFWYLRNQLFFDQELDKDARVLLLKYEAMVRDPAYLTGLICNHVGIPYKPALHGFVHARSVTEDQLSEIPGDIRALCDGMGTRLDAQWRAQAGAQPVGSPTQSA